MDHPGVKNTSSPLLPMKNVTLGRVEGGIPTCPLEDVSRHFFLNHSAHYQSLSTFPVVEGVLELSVFGSEWLLNPLPFPDTWGCVAE